jgi:uncharacterized membrane protein
MIGPPERRPVTPGRRPVAHPLLLVVLLGLAVLLFTNLIAAGFARLGLPAPLVLLVLVVSLVGSLVNIPLWHRYSAVPGRVVIRGWLLYYEPPHVEGQIIAVNVGGALVPLGISLWLLPQIPLWQGIAGLLIVAAVTHSFARIEPGVGITMPVGLAPLVALGTALVLSATTSGDHAAALAYICGSLGTLAGADLLNLGRLRTIGPGIISIGGAGVFDGIFLVGVVAALLT